MGCEHLARLPLSVLAARTATEHATVTSAHYPTASLEQAGSHQSAWMTAPLCRVVTVARLLACMTAPRSSAHLSMASCQCRVTPAGVW